MAGEGGGTKRPRPRDAPLSLQVVAGAGVRARAVECGVEHLAVLLEGGGLLVWALHRRGAVSSALSGGLHEGLGKVHTIGGLDLRQVACGWGHSAAVVRSGEVVAWGLDVYGSPSSSHGVRVRAEAMGHASNSGYLDMDVPGWRPALLSFEEGPVEQVACGWHFACALTSLGKVWQWGQSGSGHPDWGLVAVPKEVPGLPVAISAVACGSGHVMAVGAGGELFAWGENKFGQLGIGGGAPAVASPERVAGELEGKRVFHVSCSQHTAAVTDDGELFTWGCGSRWQLGHGRKRTLSEPKRVRAMETEECTRVHCGVYHTIAETSSGCAYFWGSGVFGDGGEYSWDEAPQPCLIGEGIRHVSCGGIQTAFLSTAEADENHQDEEGDKGVGSVSVADLSEVEMFRKGMRKVVIHARGTSPAEGSPLQAAGATTPRQQYEMLSTEVAKLEDLSTTGSAKVSGNVILHSGGAKGEGSAQIRKPRKRSKSGDTAVVRKSREGRKAARGEKGSSRRKPRRKSRKYAAEEVSSQVSSCPAGAPAPPVLQFKNASSEEALEAKGERTPPTSASLGTNARSVMGLPNTHIANAVGREQFQATQDRDDDILTYWTAEPSTAVPQNPGSEYTSQGIKSLAIGDRLEKTPGSSRRKTPKEGFQSPVLNYKLKEMTSAIRDMLISHQAAELGSEPRPARTSELKCDASAQTPSRGKHLAGHHPHPVSSVEFPEVEDAGGVGGSAGAAHATVETFETPFVFQNPMAAGGTFSQATATPSRSCGSLESSDADLDSGPDVNFTKNPMAGTSSPGLEPPAGEEGEEAEEEESGGPISPLRSQSTSRKLSSRSPVHLEPRVQRLELPPMTGSIHDFIAQMEATLTAGTPSAAYPKTTSAVAGLPNRSPDSQEPLGKTPEESSSPSRSSMSAFEGGIGGISVASQPTTASHSTDQNVEEMGTYFELSDVSQALLSSAHRSDINGMICVETPDVTPQKFADWNAVLSRFGTENAMQANNHHIEAEEVPRGGSGGLPLDHFLSMAEESPPKNTGEAKVPNGDSVPMEVYLETLSTQVEALILEVKSELKSKRESPAKTLTPGESGAMPSRNSFGTPTVHKGEESLSDIIDSGLSKDGLSQSVHEYSAVVSSYVAAVGERQSSPLVSNEIRVRTRQALEILFNRITSAEGSNALLPLLEETADLVNSCQEEINVAMGRLEVLCRLNHIDNTDDAEVQSQVDHLRTKQSSLRQMYEIILLKLNEGENVAKGLGSPSGNRGESGEGFERPCDSDSVASAELDAAACAVEILQQRETVNELLLRFT